MFVGQGHRSKVTRSKNVFSIRIPMGYLVVPRQLIDGSVVYRKQVWDMTEEYDAGCFQSVCGFFVNNTFVKSGTVA